MVFQQPDTGCAGNAFNNEGGFVSILRLTDKALLNAFVIIQREFQQKCFGKCCTGNLWRLSIIRAVFVVIIKAAIDNCFRNGKTAGATH